MADLIDSAMDDTATDCGHAEPAPRCAIELVPVTSDNLDKVRRINTVLFPVRYSDRFYTNLLTVGEFAQLAVVDGRCVGVVGCQPEASVADQALADQVYIMTLGVLAPYRRLGIGRYLLRHVLAHAEALNRVASDPGRRLRRVYLHVQVSNDEALHFYQAHGFVIASEVPNYYNRIEPTSAYLLVRSLLPENGPLPVTPA
ncbi:N-acetyltransferase 5 [Tieghemiomyces parasiticus]|uniref:N-terminal methionine N(alpha)-acetyltransferase NatE n=1 Tax=Tieghemiomyces parasiticus TaxID=78921 RepID=A0A9W8DNG0_9FUNG|nr:N-acetyltransferase 5 [Tieghemiomyces parasiticus]